MSNTDNNNEFSQYYDRDSFWEKVKKTGKSAGHEILEKAFLNLVHASGHPNIKLEKKVDFNKLYNERFN